MSVEQDQRCISRSKIGNREFRLLPHCRPPRRFLLLLGLLLPAFLLLFLAGAEDLSDPAPLVSQLPVPPLPPSTALFVLGDSSVNCGDNNPFNFLCNSYRLPLCNASFYRHLPDLIAERMGLPPVTEYFTTAGKASADLVSGVNFGSTPGTILSGRAIADAAGFNQTFASLFFLQTIGRQVLQASEILQHIRLDLGAAAARSVVSSSLFLLSFGNDDYAILLGGGPNATSLAQPKYGPRRFARLLITNVVRAVRGLYDEDVRRMAVMGVGPLGSAPFGASNSQWRGKEINKIVAGYNAQLSEKLMSLREELPGAEIVFCDLFRGMMEIISHPSDYGLENTRDPCCSFVGCLDTDKACAEPQKHVWWDMNNPTLAINSLLMNWAWSGSTIRICEPFSLQQLTRTMT